MVVDSSAVMPLAWVGRLEFNRATFDDIRATDAVQGEVIIGGKWGVAVLKAFLDELPVCETPPEAEDVASLEGVTSSPA